MFSEVSVSHSVHRGGGRGMMVSLEREGGFAYREGDLGWRGSA